MDHSFEEPMFLFINGVYIKDCVSIDELFEQKFINKVLPEHISEKKYNKLPEIFTNVTEWSKQIENVNIKCLNCHLFFTSTPIFIPKLIEASNIYTKGCFCYFSCAMSYIDKYKDLCKKITDTQNLLFLYKLFYGVSKSHIEMSPDIYIMDCYGGTVPTSNYIEMLKSINTCL